jgi:Uma2 family endonuclease
MATQTALPRFPSAQTTPPPFPSSEAQLRARLLAVLEEATTPQRMTYQAFLNWADEDTLAEWVNGEILLTSPASRVHQDISDFLTSILRAYVEINGLGAIISAPFQMKLANSGREPDLQFIATKNLNRLRKAHLDGPADLAVEIISPESVGRDRGDKFYEYEAAGVREYWLLDPHTRRAEFYVLDEQGRYQLTPPDDDGVFHSTVLAGFWLRVSWLWQEPLPKTVAVLRELGVI